MLPGGLGRDAVMFPFKQENRARLCGKYHHLQFIFRGKLFDTEVSTCLTSPLTG